MLRSMPTCLDSFVTLLRAMSNTVQQLLNMFEDTINCTEVQCDRYLPGNPLVTISLGYLTGNEISLRALILRRDSLR